MKIIRVKYGKRDIPLDMREYQIEGAGPVGCLDEFKKLFPEKEIEIVDEISGDKLEKLDLEVENNLKGGQEKDEKNKIRNHKII